MAQKCYRKYSGGTFDSSYIDLPCPNQQPSSGGHFGCCGVGDACLDAGLCASNGSHTGGSGYYVQSCTDSSYGDSVCSQHCTDSATSNVVFNATNQVWACCSVDTNGNSNCALASTETFSAQALWPFFVNANAVVISGGSAAQTSTTGKATSTNTISSTSSEPAGTLSVPACTHGSSHLTTGAQAGIGVGAAIAAVIIFACIAWLVILTRRIRRLKDENLRQEAEKPFLAPKASNVPAGSNTEHRAEMEHDWRAGRSELET